MGGTQYSLGALPALNEGIQRLVVELVGDLAGCADAQDYSSMTSIGGWNSAGV